MANLGRVADLLKEAVNCLSTNGSASPNVPTPGTSSSVGLPSTSSLRTIFAPYRRKSTPVAMNVPKTTWSHKFCCLSDPQQQNVPDKSFKSRLIQAGLGEKKIVLQKNKDSTYLRDILYEKFKKLQDGGGYELLRSCGRTAMEKIPIPASGYNTHYLADESGLGGAICYIRPVQEPLCLDAELNAEPSTDCLKEVCKVCGQNVPVIYLKEHVIMCYNKDPEDSDVPVLKRQKKEMPICHFACVREKTEDLISTRPENTGQCPVCQETFNISMLEVHASACGVTEKIEVIEKDDVERSLDDKLEHIHAKLNENKSSWTINVVRRHFLKTATEELTDALPDEWEKPIKIHFIGEEGIDAGGLTREFFSLLFKNSYMFENSSFCVDSQLIEGKKYFLMGKATAKAIIAGHPGPQCFNRMLAKYICTGKEPDFSEMTEDMVGRLDVTSAIAEIKTCTTENVDAVGNKHSDLLEASGFRKVLSTASLQEAVNAVVAHFSFYRLIGPLLQFMQGLKLHGVLELLQNHNESLKFFISASTSSTDIQKFYKASYSADTDLKTREEMIMYNFGKFLKAVERGAISTTWVNIDDDTEEVVIINAGHCLQALLACENIPRTVEGGMIYFDHDSSNFSTVNTCAPSITFSKTSIIEEYDFFVKHFLSLIVESVGFGVA